MAANYELPEEVNEKRLRTLGMEVEMTTFKTNVSHEVEAKDISRKTLKQTSHQMDNGATVVKPFGRLVKLFCGKKPGKIFENDVALDQFCKDHGFVDHFEIKLRDWESGQQSVFGQAVNSLLNIIV